MTASHKWLTAVCVLALGVFGAMTLPAADKNAEKDDADEAEQTIPIDQLPAAVQAALKKAAHGAKIREVERETENGQTVYEVELVIETKLEVELTEDGKVLEFEIEQGHDHDDEDE